uniref:VWFA domain-containing protein n=1 Tax=Biomphalaria glabrata TaxID=6526 RepID=A0A2C9LNM5_BIOGL
MNCTCPAFHWKCGDNVCVDESRRCDGYSDCRDNSDERNCINCTASGWRCNDGSCIQTGGRCDAFTDCSDASDEVNCSCPDFYWKCGDNICVHENKQCDGINDCLDTSDERNCTNCKSSSWSCNDGTCIKNIFRCDGDIHCRDKSDEMNCSNCDEFAWKCKNNQCILKYQYCDGEDNCDDRSDETSCSCPGSQWQCDGRNCIPQSHICDGVPDCIDKSDEQNCSCPESQLKCDRRNCIHQSHICDGVQDCNDKSDEKNCNKLCNPSEWRCQTGQCIQIGLWCDGSYHCTDGSDEKYCVSVPEKLNIVIMLEAKDSDYIKSFIKDLLRDVTIDGKNIRVGIVVYSENASIVVNLTASHKADIFQAVNKIKWIISHNANYEDAFNCTHSMVTSFDESKNIETIVVFVTFTLQETNYRSAVKGAKFAKENGMHIIAIGVSLINNTFLDLIASHPTEDNIYVVKYFQDLNTIQPQLISKLSQLTKDTPQIIMKSTAKDKETKFTTSASSMEKYVELIAGLVAMVIVVVIILVFMLKLRDKLWCFSRHLRNSTGLTSE